MSGLKSTTKGITNVDLDFGPVTEREALRGVAQLAFVAPSDQPIRAAEEAQSRGPIVAKGVIIKQGVYGDCQTLAPIIALANTTDGMAHLKSLVKYVGDGNYEVEFPGKKEKSKVNRADLQDPNLSEAKEFIKVIEKAIVEIHRAEKGVVNPYKLLLGETKGASYSVKLNENAKSIAADKISSELIEQAKAGKALLVAYKHSEDQARDINGDSHPMPSPHAYALRINSRNNVEIQDPHNSAKPIEITQAEAGRLFSFVIASNTPSHQIQFPEDLRKLQNLAANHSEALQLMHGSAGAFSIDGVPKKFNPSLVVSYDNANAVLTAELERVSLLQKDKAQQLNSLNDKANKFAQSLDMQDTGDALIAMRFRSLREALDGQTGADFSRAEEKALQDLVRDLNKARKAELSSAVNLELSPAELRKVLNAYCDAVEPKNVELDNLSNTPNSAKPATQSWLGSLRKILKF